MKNIIIDLDNTICFTSDSKYESAVPNLDVVGRLREYREKGFQITIFTSRNMRTFSGDLNKINAITLPKIIEWLESNHVPYDQVYCGKPWCGEEGFYIDDRAIRPSEFVDLNLEEIHRLLKIK